MSNPTHYFIKYWLPAFAWMGLVAVFSSAEFQSANSWDMLGYLLKLLKLKLSPVEFAYVHAVIRKWAHFGSYAVMSAICFRAVRGPEYSRRWKIRFALAALGICLAVAMADEFHQTFIPERSGSLKDVLLDMTGALFAQLVLISVYAKTRRSILRSD